MKQAGKNLVHIGIGLIILFVGIQVLWSILLQLKVAIIIGLLLLGSAYVVYRVRQYRSGSGELFRR